MNDKSNLQLEVREGALADVQPLSGRNVLITPAIDEEYWLLRVKVSDKQAVVGFPKFFTLGIGFAKEKDWNTNLPYTSNATEIYDHIKHNKGSTSIPDARCIHAIEMIQDAWKALKAANG
jgi:hypothetical protein